MAAHLGGQRVMAGLGSCHNANGMSGEMMLIQDTMIEAMDYLRDALDPAVLDEGLDSIACVGPDGDYLTDDVTLKNLRSDEFLRKSLFVRTGGYHADAPGVIERAGQRAEEILEAYEYAVSGNVREAIARWAEEKVCSSTPAG
jgi:trimethylamine:corrinoid methyltransferase-like protein